MSEIKFKYISTGAGGNSVWAVGKTDGTIYRLFGDAGLVGWIPDKSGKAEVVAAVHFGEAWCVNQAHEIWHVENAQNLDSGDTWTRVPTQSGKADARTISIGGDGTVWYADTNDGTLFYRENNAWHKDPAGGKATVVAAVSKSQIWCVNQAHEIWHLDNGKWTQVSTQSGKADAATISAGADGTVWYIQTDGALFRRDSSTWHLVEGRATVVSVGSKEYAFCVNKDGDVFTLVQGAWQKIVEIGPNESWGYTVGAGEHLLQIVRTLYQVQDAVVVNRIADEIARLSKLTNRDNLAVGQKLTMPPIGYR
jgi:hypothetical protein